MWGILDLPNARKRALRPVTTIVILVLLLLIAVAGIVFVAQLLTST